MKRNLIALMLLLPLLFVLAVFSSAKTASLGVPVAANGIVILGKPEGGYRIDLSTYSDELKIEAKVTPEAAHNREYTYRAEGAVTVDGEGRVRPAGTGEGRVYAVSKDGGFEDSVDVLVYATRLYDFSFSLTAGGAESVLEGEDGYHAALPAGRYSYSVSTQPKGHFPAPEFTLKEGFAVFSEGSGTVLFPFGGRTVFEVSLAGLKKTVTLDLFLPETGSGLVVNGGAPSLVLDRDAERATFFVAGGPFEVLPDPNLKASEVHDLGGGRYEVQVFFSEERGDFTLTLLTEEGREEVTVTFEDFDFFLRSALPVQLSGEASILSDTPTAFYAVPSVQAEGITYRWTGDKHLSLMPNGDGSVCRVTADGPGDFWLEVRAFRGGVQLDLFEKRLRLSAVERVTAVRFAEETALGLARRRAVAGENYENGGFSAYRLPLTPLLVGGAADSLAFSLSDPSKGELTQADGKLFFLAKGRGEVTVTAEWKGNASFGTDVRAELPLYAVGDGVAVNSSPALYAAEEAGRAVVLEGDIALGTDESGVLLPPAEREALLREMRSTFNTEYFKNASGLKEEDAAVKVALEFKGDVFGNGHTLDAGALTAERDGAGKPRWFRGPLPLVKFGEVASVAAQDNIAFLARTDAVFWNTTFLGCGDEVLAGEAGYDLSALNTVGTALEINADVTLLNCRVRNGRNVVRVFGGNREGEGYFAEPPSPDGRTTVRIEGCILSQGREFLLKIGSNRAIRATKERGAEPDLVLSSGELLPMGGEVPEDCFRTEVTLSDSVLERSGLFTIGLECNFAGELLMLGGEDAGLRFDGWRGTGGTSYPSRLRLFGDVRLYDWKELSLVDSSTLIETELPELKLDIGAMLRHVAEHDPEKFGELFAGEEGKRYVHGGIACYGGGKNYSAVDLSACSRREGTGEYAVNMSVLGDAEGNVGYQGRILPAAAGTQDFRFFLYEASGKNALSFQREDERAGTKYLGIVPLPPPSP